MAGRYKRLARLNGSGAQYGALPWRRVGDAVEVLLVTSRQTRRWTIPKGWPEKTLTPAEAAAREALEEAGVLGATSEAVGQYHYNKRLRDGAVVVCVVTVFPLEVVRCEDDWQEAAQRERAWLTPAVAASLVAEPELKALILDFDPALRPLLVKPEAPPGAESGLASGTRRPSHPIPDSTAESQMERRPGSRTSPRSKQRD